MAPKNVAAPIVIEIGQGCEARPRQRKHDQEQQQGRSFCASQKRFVATGHGIAALPDGIRL
jgi:hypothetical protein